MQGDPWGRGHLEVNAGEICSGRKRNPGRARKIRGCGIEERRIRQAWHSTQIFAAQEGVRHRNALEAAGHQVVFARWNVFDAVFAFFVTL